MDASKLPSLVSLLSDSSSDSLNKLWNDASQQTGMTSPWNNFALFLTRLLNETPREADQIPQKLKDNLSQLFKKMEEEYETNSSELASCTLINQTLSSAAMAVETCSDRVKLGYLYMQFFTKESPQPYIDVLNNIQQFVDDISIKKIIYHTTSNTFQRVDDVAKSDKKFSETKAYLNPSEDCTLSISDRYNLACAIITAQNNEYQALIIGDPIEDILNLAYMQPNIPDKDIHKIDMKYRSCCTLKEDQLEAAIQYLQ